jgi:hypothetical protein
MIAMNLYAFLYYYIILYIISSFLIKKVKVIIKGRWGVGGGGVKNRQGKKKVYKKNVYRVTNLPTHHLPPFGFDFV